MWKQKNHEHDNCELAIDKPISVTCTKLHFYESTNLKHPITSQCCFDVSGDFNGALLCECV